jgi:hypothetical protein
LPCTDAGGLFEDLNMLCLLHNSGEQKEWRTVLEKVGATVVTCSHFNQSKEFLEQHGINLLVSKETDLLVGRPLRRVSVGLGGWGG